jgi:hypothetical protein
VVVGLVVVVVGLVVVVVGLVVVVVGLVVVVVGLRPQARNAAFLPRPLADEGAATMPT